MFMFIYYIEDQIWQLVQILTASMILYQYFSIDNFIDCKIQIYNFILKFYTSRTRHKKNEKNLKKSIISFT